jgi:peptidase E
MLRREFLVSSALGTAGALANQLPSDTSDLAVGAPSTDRLSQARQMVSVSTAPEANPMTPEHLRATRKILIAGGNFATPFIRYMAQLTGKTRPRICYLPTASADNAEGSLAFFRNCAPLNVTPFVQESFIESLSQKQGWDEVLLSMDAIVCSGGNTLNQQAIWKAQGIDVVLRDAWDRGIVLGGASAGSLCWFEEGTTDSRPKTLSIVKCLGFLKGSHSPHYDAEAGRRPLYQKLISSGEMKPGYACDNDAGIYFEDNEVKRVVSAREAAKVYYVSMVNGRINERVMTPESIA